MKDNLSRIAIVLLGLALCVLALQALLPGDDANGAPPGASDPAATPSTDGATPFDPLAGSALTDVDPATVQHPPADIAEVMPRREVGPPLAKGTEVSVELRRKPGTVARYRITNAIAQRNRDNGMSGGQRWTYDVTTNVTGVDDAGLARVRLTIDEVRIQTLSPDGMYVDFDTRDPNPALLRDPARALSIRPLVAVVGIPVEFALDSHGGCAGVEGLDGWHEAWVEAVEDVQPGTSRRAAPPYTADTILHEWSELLFPPILGGTLTAGEPRDVQILRDTLHDAFVSFRGPLNVTHDDGDVFRLRLVTKAAMFPRQGPPRSPQEAAVEKVHIQASDDSYEAAWRFGRKTGRLHDAEIDAKYQMWVSWLTGQSSTGQNTYQPIFLDVERSTRVELIAD